MKLRAESTVVAVRDAYLGLSLSVPYWTWSKHFLHVLVSTLDPTEMLNIPFL